jgi:hypothetical protein
MQLNREVSPPQAKEVEKANSSYLMSSPGAQEIRTNMTTIPPQQQTPTIPDNSANLTINPPPNNTTELGPGNSSSQNKSLIDNFQNLPDEICLKIFNYLTSRWREIKIVGKSGLHLTKK